MAFLRTTTALWVALVPPLNAVILSTPDGGRGTKAAAPLSSSSSSSSSSSTAAAATTLAAPAGATETLVAAAATPAAATPAAAAAAAVAAAGAGAGAGAAAPSSTLAGGDPVRPLSGGGGSGGATGAAQRGPGLGPAPTLPAAPSTITAAATDTTKAATVATTVAAVNIARSSTSSGPTSSMSYDGSKVSPAPAASSAKAALVRRQPGGGSHPDDASSEGVYEVGSAQLAPTAKSLARQTPTKELQRLRREDKISPSQGFVKYLMKGLCASGWKEANNRQGLSLQECSEHCWSHTDCTYFGYNDITKECVPFATETCEKFDGDGSAWPMFVTYEARWALQPTSLVQTRTSCDYGQAACKTALEDQGLQVGGGGFAFADEYKTSGCFYYYSGKLATIGFYGTVKGGADLLTKEQLSYLDVTDKELARPIAYPSCHTGGDPAPGCMTLGSITLDLADRNAGCAVGGMAWVNVTDNMNLTNFDERYEPEWDTLTTDWTRTMVEDYIGTVRSGHEPECQNVCRDQVWQRGKLCCYFNPADNMGCFVKPQANVSVQGTGRAGLCAFGLGATE